MLKRNNKSTRSNSKSATKIDKVLLQRLILPDRVVSLGSPESKQKTKNRLAFLNRIQESEDFNALIDLCEAHNLDSSKLIKQTKIPFEDDSVSFGSSAEEDCEVEQAPTVTRKNMNTTMKQNMSYEELGKIITINLPNGSIFCTAWIDAMLNTKILEIVIAEDGMSVLMKTKTPEPKSAKEFSVDVRLGVR
jgi:hypothetical protein